MAATPLIKNRTAKRLGATLDKRDIPRQIGRLRIAACRAPRSAIFRAVEQQWLPDGSAGISLGPVGKWCATALMAAGLMSTSGSAVAQDVPPLGPRSSFQVFAKNSDSQRVFDIRGVPKISDIQEGFISAGTVRFSPKLCNATYRVLFVFTTKGHVTKSPYRTQVRSARRDGITTRCPFAGLPSRGLKSMHVRATIAGKPLLQFRAHPVGRPGSTFARLKMPRMTFGRRNTPAGSIRVSVRARYRSHRQHTIKFVVKTDLP